jgi:hypothetical protein
VALETLIGDLSSELTLQKSPMHPEMSSIGYQMMREACGEEDHGKEKGAR